MILPHTFLVKGVFTALLTGLIFISLGALLLVFSPYKFILKMKTTFSAGAEGFEMWRLPPVEVFLKVYIYNITNKEAFLAGNERLRVQEVGPYVYRELGEHADPEFNPNGTVSSVPNYPLEWVPQLSNGSEDDVLCLPNVALLSFANVIANKNFFTRLAVNSIIAQTNSNPIVEQTAREFMFGYNSVFVTIGNTLIPNWIYFDKLGLIDRMYDFTGDVETTYTGENDNHLSGILATYNRLPYLPQWEAPCNRLEGSSDGYKFPTSIRINESLRFFRKSLCRSLPMVRTGVSTMMKGVPTDHYIFEKDALDNGSNNSENTCFCYRGRCLPSGLIDVTHCYYGFPIALSYPHFYLADPKLIEEIDGSTPSQDRHETYFYINPETGTPTKVSVKMQINIALGDLTGMDRCGQFSNLVIPMLWTDITMPELSRIMVVKLFLLVRVLPVAEVIAQYLFLIGGVSFILLSIGGLIFAVKVKKLPVPMPIAVSPVITSSSKMQRLSPTLANGVGNRGSIFLVEKHVTHTNLYARSNITDL